MPDYTINAVDPRGHRRSFRAAAADEPALREKLRQDGVWPLRIRPVTAARQLARLRMPPAEFIPLLHQLEMMLRAGVTPDRALQQLAADAPAGPPRTLLTHIHDQVAQGRTIHESCRFFARQFPPHVAAVIAAGEAAAQLPESLHALAGHLAEAEEIRRTARRALIYPLIVLIAVGGLIVFLVGGVVPRFAEIFESMHLALPWLTRALIRASAGLQEHWPVLLGVTGGLGATAVLAPRWPVLRHLRDAGLLHVPVLGETIRCLATARFAGHCRLLHEAGIPLLDSLGSAAELMNHAVLERQLRAAREGVAVGRALYASLPPRHAFPRFIIPALKAGETTGQLGLALRHIETYAAARARERLATALALLEPLLLAGLTAIVGLIALSFFLPLFSLLGGLNPR